MSPLGTRLPFCSLSLPHGTKGTPAIRNRSLRGGAEDSVQDPGLDLAWEDVGGLEKANPCLLLKSRARPLSLHPALVPLPTLIPPSAMKLAVLFCIMV